MRHMRSASICRACGMVYRPTGMEDICTTCDEAHQQSLKPTLEVTQRGALQSQWSLDKFSADSTRAWSGDPEFLHTFVNAMWSRLDDTSKAIMLDRFGAEWISIYVKQD